MIRRALASLLLLAVWIGPGRAQAFDPVPHLRQTITLRSVADTGVILPRLRCSKPLTCTRADTFAVFGTMVVVISRVNYADSAKAWALEVTNIQPDLWTPFKHDTTHHLAMGGVLSLPYEKAMLGFDTLQMLGVTKGDTVAVLGTGLSAPLDITVAGGETVNVFGDSTTFGDTNPNCDGHDTFVAGQIGSSVWGLAPGTPIYMYRIFIVTGTCGYFGSDAVIALGKAGARHFTAANLSAGGSWMDPNAIADYNATGGVFCVAAGNNGGANLQPASEIGSIAISALDPGGALAGYSSHDSTTRYAMPGSGITGDAPCTGCAAGSASTEKSGTSMATPYCSATVALERKIAPNMSRDSLLRLNDSVAVDLGSGYKTMRADRFLKALAAAGWATSPINHVDVVPGVPFTGCTTIAGSQRFDAFADVPWILWSISGRTLCFSGTPPANPAGSLTIRGQ